ncbi:MAG: triose-phosphate isomerase [Actinomycetota bacterium]
MARRGRRPLMAGNWKMNLNHLEAIALVQKLAFALPEKYFAKVEVAVLVPFTSLRGVQSLITGDRLLIRYGAQDLSPKDSGAYTGDVSGPMLAKLDCHYVIVGHSERREYHDEDDRLVGSKVRAALRHGLVPILCVGEGLEIREAGGHLAHSTEQLRAALKGLSAEQVRTVVVAYEPIWAIGTGRTASADDAQETIGTIRGVIRKVAGEAAEELRVQYGGSVKPGNIAELMGKPDIDGALVGGASLEPREFALIVRFEMKGRG